LRGGSGLQTISPENSQSALLHRGGPAGTWGNLGLWDGANTYAEACAALAIAIGKAAGILPGERVLSLACGAGDELALWIEHFEAQSAVGVEANAKLAENARRKFVTAPAAGRITVFEQSALDPQGLPAQGFDRVVCVDAAYHLAPRSRFLHHAFRCLRPGGRLAFTDLLSGAGAGAMVRGGARHARGGPGLRADLGHPARRLRLQGSAASSASTARYAELTALSSNGIPARA
jgi:SAM-dependent methyltransferase